MSKLRPAFYAPTGTRRGDFLALLHPPYTLWFLSYATIGAALAPDLGWLRLSGTLAALALGLGVGAHALDELHDRPLGTAFTHRALVSLAWTGLGGAIAVAIVGAIVISTWVMLWAVAGAVLAAGYTLERPTRLHTDLGFALAWGGFPVLIGYWAQTESMSMGAATAALAAVALSRAQRALSTPARFVRRHAPEASAHLTDDVSWNRRELLETWETALQWLSWAMPIFAIALLLSNT